jgi:hypothetical protein
MDDTAASVLLAGPGGLLASVVELESEGIVPSLTALCPCCSRVSVLAKDNGGAAHVIALWRRVGPFLDCGRKRPDSEAEAGDGHQVDGGRL